RAPPERPAVVLADDPYPEGQLADGLSRRAPFEEAAVREVDDQPEDGADVDADDGAHDHLDDVEDDDVDEPGAEAVAEARSRPARTAGAASAVSAGCPRLRRRAIRLTGRLVPGVAHSETIDRKALPL